MYGLKETEYLANKELKRVLGNAGYVASNSPQDFSHTQHEI